LGDLRYVRLWVDNSGRGECESWYCNRVIIKDLHTGKIYRFPIYNWFGSFMGDGEVGDRLLFSFKPIIE
uniref:PLAT domain-containing protein n=1 Tax=Haemonchus placei TaxID=6290 RepID=A0A0N4WEU7_HAEPC